jgi:hypothetical protein
MNFDGEGHVTAKETFFYRQATWADIRLNHYFQKEVWDFFEFCNTQISDVRAGSKYFSINLITRSNAKLFLKAHASGCY